MNLEIIWSLVFFNVFFIARRKFYVISIQVKCFSRKLKILYISEGITIPYWFKFLLEFTNGYIPCSSSWRICNRFARVVSSLLRDKSRDQGCKNNAKIRCPLRCPPAGNAKSPCPGTWEGHRMLDLPHNRHTYSSPEKSLEQYLNRQKGRRCATRD